MEMGVAGLTRERGCERLERRCRFSRAGSGGGFRTDPSFSDSLDRGLNVVVAP